MSGNCRYTPNPYPLPPSPFPTQQNVDDVSRTLKPRRPAGFSSVKISLYTDVVTPF